MTDGTERSDIYPVRVPLVTQPMGMLQTLRAVRGNVLSIIPEIATRQPIVSGTMVKRWHMVMDPTALRRILRDRYEDYPKSLVTKNMLEPAIGNSLFIAEGAAWRWQRRTVAPVFSRRNVESLAPVMTHAATCAAERLAMRDGAAVNLFDEMIATTFDVIVDVTFSGDEGIDRARVHRAIEAYLATAAKVDLFDLFGFPGWVPRVGRMFTGKHLAETRALADRAIAARRNATRKKMPDLLDFMLDGKDPESGRIMTVEELRDNLLTFIVAGHETTALALSWALYLLAFDQKVQNRAHSEARQTLGTRPATVADLPNLGYTRQIIDEALRLYPPAALVSRTALRPDTLCGREIRAGDTVILPYYALHRNSALWEDADRFDPDRFADGMKPARFSYLPFGDGPRICIGASFALQEATIILATLLAQYRFTPIPGKNPAPVMILTLRPEGGVWLKVENRAA